MDCTEVLQQLQEYFDEDTRAKICAVIEDHLARCSNCQVYVDTVRKTIVLYQNDRQVEMPTHLTSRLEVALAREYGSGTPSAD